MSAEPPELWWSEAEGLIQRDEHMTRGELWALDPGTPDGFHYVRTLPDDAVPLGVIEDPKHRGPSYERGFRDGYLACRAGVPYPTEENP